jgi:hypothetical protein
LRIWSIWRKIIGIGIMLNHLCPKKDPKLKFVVLCTCSRTHVPRSLRNGGEMMRSHAKINNILGVGYRFWDVVPKGLFRRQLFFHMEQSFTMSSNEKNFEMRKFITHFQVNVCSIAMKF